MAHLPTLQVKLLRWLWGSLVHLAHHHVAVCMHVNPQLDCQGKRCYHRVLSVGDVARYDDADRFIKHSEASRAWFYHRVSARLMSS